MIGQLVNRYSLFTLVGMFLALDFPQACAKDLDRESFVSIFDGESLTGWVGATEQYEAVDGMLRCKPGANGNLYTEKQYADFVLRFEFRLTPGANNGVALRAPLEGDAAYVGMESQVLDNAAEAHRDLQPHQFHGSIYGVAAARRGQLRPVGEWNREEIRCQGSHVRITLNGKVIVDVDLNEVAPAGKTIDGKKHPGLLRTTGHIGLLGHGHQVDFRNLKIRTLDSVQPF